MDRSLPQPLLRKERKTTTKMKKKAEEKQHKLKHIINSATKCISLMRIDWNAIDEQGKAVYITWSFAYVCWLLQAFSDKCGDEIWMTGMLFFEMTLPKFFV
jgi:hypothetical protein